MMKRIDLRHGLLLATTLICGCGDAYADRGPMPYGSSAAPSGSVSALPPESQAAVIDGHKPWAPTPFQGVFPTEPSEKPKKAEWQNAPIAKEVRVTQPDCKVQRIREWYRFTCGGVGATLVTGSPKDVELTVERDQPGADSFPTGVVIVFPARRGDKRLLQTYRWSKWAPGQVDATLSEQFLEGDEAPLITFEGVRWDF